MEILPTISEFILYLFAALLFVLITTLIFSKTKNDEEFSEEERINAERERAKLYLRNHPYYARSLARKRNSYTRTPVYSIPTYSDSPVRSRLTGEIVIQSNTDKEFGKKTDELNHRYSILNGKSVHSNTHVETLQNPYAFSSLRSHHQLN